MKKFLCHLLFRDIDDRFKEIGFEKIEENAHGVRYERYNPKFKYTHVLDILRKHDGKHIVQSFDKDLFDGENIGNCCVGLTGYEMKLALKKMKQMKLYSK